ncbi:unnamed protein product [Strongylus vulgaris]|uniref:Uncharacterized protein n=1 Tax=Strongylus vulgaris TaxID=40348 RepID=A0A3P7IUR9_STRVU|nr:unnamed protein product [Strongylus vulgaris]
MGVTQRYDSCGDRPHSHQPKGLLDFSVVPSFSSGTDHRLKAGKEDGSQVGRTENAYDRVRLEKLLTTCDWLIEDGPTKDYDLLLRGLGHPISSDL